MCHLIIHPVFDSFRLTVINSVADTGWMRWVTQDTTLR